MDMNVATYNKDVAANILLNQTVKEFLSRVSTLTRDIDIANLSVRPSVRHVPVLDENGLTYCHSFFVIVTTH